MTSRRRRMKSDISFCTNFKKSAALLLCQIDLKRRQIPLKLPNQILSRTGFLTQFYSRCHCEWKYKHAHIPKENRICLQVSKLCKFNSIIRNYRVSAEFKMNTVHFIERFKSTRDVFRLGDGRRLWPATRLNTDYSVGCSICLLCRVLYVVVFCWWWWWCLTAMWTMN